MRIEDLRRALIEATKQHGASKVVMPRVTARQVANGPALLAAIKSGRVGQCKLATHDWDVQYLADTVPDLASPAWTKALAGNVYSAAWYNSAWSGRYLVAIDPAQVAAATAGFRPYLSEANFPAGFFSAAQASGNDVLFTASDGVTKLAHDLVHWAPGTTAMEAHIQALAVSTTTPTYLWAYVGNAGATNQRDAVGVWQSTHRFVYHAGEVRPAAWVDSTGRGYTGTNGVNPGGNVGKLFATGGETFDGFNDGITLTNDPAAGLNGLGQLTVMAWIKRVGIGAQQGVLSLRMDATNVRKINLTFDATDHIVVSARPSVADVERTATTTGTFTDTTDWHHIAATISIATDTITIYWDGVAQAATGTTTWTDAAFGADGGSAAQYIGRIGYFNGLIDEVRGQTSATNANGILTMVRNQNSPGTFYSVGALQSRADYEGLLHIVDGV